ncbi:ankyrin repeat domain-containing protein [Chitinophaga sedimenti]|uniref:ankyrin repeat domain-containing protein n=1 Tax=Chitinophaga sedimenti TaxID=2033606 RepID=UPI0020045099|nr:ankyrin repeat domain-containing protein [Chitinophaga sedimenti]MCK7555018.1 ankyrin repeat domain-containing protein [Chitinophaga sedimenti]
MHTFFDLYHAAEIGDMELVKTILTAQPELLKEKDEYEFSIMHAAALAEDPQLITYLAGLGADVNAKNDEGLTPLHIVLYPEVAETLIKLGADVNAKSMDDETPLHIQVAEGEQQYDMVKLLLQHGANKNAKDVNGERPYEIARDREEDEEILKLLK